MYSPLRCRLWWTLRHTKRATEKLPRGSECQGKVGGKAQENV